jgi:hypothetical protein
MNKVAKAGTRSKPVKKAASVKSASAVKSVKKRSKVSSAVKPVKKWSKVSAVVKPVKKAAKKVKPLKYPTDAEIERSRIAIAKIADEFEAKQAALGLPEPKPEIVPLAEVEVLAAKAVKMIKANRTVSPEKKARRLASVAETLERARGWGGLSKSGAWGLKHPFGIMKVLDWEAVLR